MDCKMVNGFRPSPHIVFQSLSSVLKINSLGLGLGFALGIKVGFLQITSFRKCLRVSQLASTNQSYPHFF